MRNYNKRFRVGKSKFFIYVEITIDPERDEYNPPEINIPAMNGQNAASATAVQIALGQAIKYWREIYKMTGKPVG